MRASFSILAATALLVMLLVGTTASPLQEPVDAVVAMPENSLLAGFTCGHGEPIPLIDLPTVEVPAGSLLLEECPGIRPGARQSNGCTLNHVFTDGTDLYVGTAGHCVGPPGSRVGATGVGEFGTVVFRCCGPPWIVGQDFGLVRVDEHMRELVDPNICTWHGPWDAAPTTHEFQPVHHYGWGVATNQNSYERARTGVILWTSPTAVHFMSYASGGDSGSPLNNVLGSALGIITHVQSNTQGDRLVYGTHIEHAMSMARSAGFDIELVPGDLVEGVI